MVSRHHAEIWCEKSGIWLQDLASRGGTRLNGIWLKANVPTKVVVGDRLTLAELELRLRSSLDDTRCSDEPNAPTDEMACDTMAIISDRDQNAKALINQLSAAELQIVLWMRRGVDDDDHLAMCLHRSPHTVRTQVAAIFQKLNVHSRSNLLSLFHRIDLWPELDRRLDTA